MLLLQTYVETLGKSAVRLLHDLDDLFSHHLHLSTHVVKASVHVYAELIAILLILHILIIEALAHLVVSSCAIRLQLAGQLFEPLGLLLKLRRALLEVFLLALEFLSLVQCALQFATQLRQLLLPKHRNLLTLSRTGLCRLIARLLDALLKILLRLFEISLLGNAAGQQQDTDHTDRRPGSLCIQIVPHCSTHYDEGIPRSLFADNGVTTTATNSTSPTSRSSPQDVLADSAGSTIPLVHCRTAALSHTTPRIDDWRRHRVRPDSSGRLLPVFHRVRGCSRRSRVRHSALRP